MDVDGLNAAVVNPDLRLERTEQQGETPGSEQPRSRSPLSSPPPLCEHSEDTHHQFLSLSFSFSFPLAERRRKSDTSQSQSRSLRRRAAGTVARGEGLKRAKHMICL